MKLPHLLLFAVSCLGLVAASRGADCVLVSGGVSRMPIVVAKDASPRTHEAAAMLADYISMMSGAKPAVLDGTPEAAPASAIWIGVQPAIKQLFPKTDFDFRNPEEILILTNERHVVIAGRDRWDPAHPDGLRDKVIKNQQQEYGTINAVLTFMQDQLDVRWLWPGDLGEDVPHRDSIAIAPMEYRYHPQIRSRQGVFQFSSLGNIGYGHAQDWTMKQRLQLDSFTIEGGHGFGDWWDRYHERYPEIFALQPDGTRSGFPNPRTAKLCMSNPKVWELWLKDVEEQLAKDPNRTLFNASPNDSWASGHCTCANCTAWDDPNGEPRLFIWKGKKEMRPATSDRDVTFANTLAKLLEQKYPGKGYRVMMLSYGHSRPAPVKARPASNVVMSCVANFLGRKGLVDIGSSRGDTYRQQLEGWSSIVPSMLWRPNTGSPAGWQQGLPDLSVQQTIHDFKDVAAAHCEGIYIDSVWEHWATQGPQLYMMAQLAWNPGIDADSVLADYYERGFGAAAPAVREYFEGLEKARTAFTDENLDGDVFAFQKLYTSQLLKESQDRLDRAAAAVPAGSIYARRVAFVQTGLSYTRLVMENIRLMEGYWKKKDPAIADQVKKNWAESEKLIADNPGAINGKPVRPLSPRMAGLHPDYPPVARKKRTKANDLDLN